MREDLERRERATAGERSEEEVAKARLAAELERMRREAAERQAQREHAMAATVATARATLQANQQLVDEQLRRTLKVAIPRLHARCSSQVHWCKCRSPTLGLQQPAFPAPFMLRWQQELAPGAGWSLRRRVSLIPLLQVYWQRQDGDYTADQLREAFAAVGQVEDLVIRDSKKKKKGSAIVVMATADGAAAAASSALGSLKNPLLVVPHNKVPAVGQSDGADELVRPQPPRPTGTPLFPSASGRQEPVASTPGPSFPSFSYAPVGKAHTDYENVTLMKMRQAAERARLAREMADQDDRSNLSMHSN